MLRRGLETGHWKLDPALGGRPEPPRHRAPLQGWMDIGRKEGNPLVGEGNTGLEPQELGRKGGKPLVGEGNTGLEPQEQYTE